MQQMALDLQDRIDPPTCPHRVPTGLDGISQCAAHDMTFVGCMKSVWFDSAGRCMIQDEYSKATMEWS